MLGQSGGYKVNPPGAKVSKGSHYFSGWLALLVIC